MNHQIRISPDRRREVSVMRQRQTKMPNIRRLIDRLWHRADNQRLYERASLRVPEPSRDRLQIASRNLLRYLGVYAQRMKCGVETLELLLFGLAVNTVERRDASL